MCERVYVNLGIFKIPLLVREKSEQRIAEGAAEIVETLEHGAQISPVAHQVPLELGQHFFYYLWYDVSYFRMLSEICFARTGAFYKYQEVYISAIYHG